MWHTFHCSSLSAISTIKRKWHVLLSFFLSFSENILIKSSTLSMKICSSYMNTDLSNEWEIFNNMLIPYAKSLYFCKVFWLRFYSKSPVACYGKMYWKDSITSESSAVLVTGVWNIVNHWRMLSFFKSKMMHFKVSSKDWDLRFLKIDSI